MTITLALWSVRQENLHESKATWDYTAKACPPKNIKNESWRDALMLFKGLGLVPST